MKIYTKQGDQKKTSLLGNEKRFKSDLRIHCYGTFDEALAQIGLLDHYVDIAFVNKQLNEIMRILFKVNQDLANPNQVIEYEINQSHVTLLEQYIDSIESLNTPLTSFIMPTGILSACQANITRTIVRRAERVLVELSKSEVINEAILPLVNRMSDYFFVLTRYLNLEGSFVEETV